MSKKLKPNPRYEWRVYDRKAHRYYEHAERGIERHTPHGSQPYSFANLINDPHFVLEQNTTFTDQNQQPIFEGDLIDVQHTRYLSVVQWINVHGCWQLKIHADHLPGYHYFTLANIDAAEMHICGNCHDQAEALQMTKYQWQRLNL